MFGLSKLESSLAIAVVAVLAFGLWLAWNDHKEIAKGRAQITSQITTENSRIDKQVAQQTAILKAQADLADKGAQHAQQLLAQYKLDHPDSAPVFVRRSPGCEGSKPLPNTPTVAAVAPNPSSQLADDSPVQVRPGSAYDVGPGYAILVSVAEQLAIDEGEFQGREITKK